MIYIATPPCFHCHMERDCATQKLACQAFLYYVETGRSVPARTCFEGDRPKKEGSKLIFADRPEPTHQLFLKELHYETI